MQMSEEIQTAEKIIIPHISTKLPLPLFDGATAMLLFCATASYLGFKEVAKDAFLFQNALVGAWWLSHIADVIATYKMNKIDLWMDFGIDSKNIPEMGLPTRKQEARELADKVNDLYVPN